MLRRKLFRDIKRNISQFITIFLMILLGVFVFAGIHSYMDGMKQSGDSYYKNNNLEDLWVSSQNISNEDLNTIKKMYNVKDAERVLTLITNLDNYKDTTLETNFIENNNISKMYIVDGEDFEINKTGVWVDSYFAHNLNLKVGDKVSFTYKNIKIEEQIKGLVNTPDHVYTLKNDTELFPNHKDFGYAYLSINEIPDELIYDSLKSKTGINDINLIKRSIPNFNIKDYYIFNQALVDIDDTNKINDVKSNIENNIKDVIAVTDRTSSLSYSAYQSEIDEGNTYSGVFTFLFLFIALLSVVTTMNRFVKRQRTQIGTLKALGFKDRVITRHYISYGFYISLIATIIGTLVGNYVLGSFFMNMEMEYFEVPVYHTSLLNIVYYLDIAVVILTTLATYLSCKKILKEPASESLRLMVPKVKKTKFTITTKGIFKKASMSTKWNLRDISRNKGRSIMAITGIVGSCMLLVCAFGMLDSMNSYISWQFDKIDNFNYQLNLEDNYKDSDYNKLINDYGNNTSMGCAIEVKLGDKKDTNVLTINDAKDYLKYTDHDINYMDLNDDGIYVTEKYAINNNLKVGDTISWHIFGDDKYYDTKITGLNRDPQSQSLSMTRKYATSIGLTYKADSLYTNEDLSNIKKIDGVSTIQSKQNLKKEMLSMLKNMKTMVVIMVTVSAILGFVIIYNLGVLSFSEKQYQFATLKVLGFKDKQIKNIFVKQNIWLTIIAIIIGLPLGYFMTDYIFNEALGDNYDFNTYISLFTYLLSAFGTLAVSIVVNKILALKVNSIDMVSSLKGNE